MTTSFPTHLHSAPKYDSTSPIQRPAGGAPAPALDGLTVAPRGHDVVDRFERKTPSVAQRAPGSAVGEGQGDTGLTDRYRTLTTLLDGAKMGDDILLDQEVNKAIHSTQKPASKAEQDARNTFLRAAAKAGYDITSAPHNTNR
jgi:hypothetical protein